jgi:hypothetical protein
VYGRYERFGVALHVQDNPLVRWKVYRLIGHKDATVESTVE